MKRILMIILAITAITLGAHAQISEVKLIGGSQSEVNNLKSTFKKNGWTIIESNLNAGTSGDCIYLCYKTAGDGCITDLYLSSGSNPVSNTLTVNGKTYTLCPYEGGGHFLSVRGDLNSNCGGDDIHLYYTKSGFSDNRCVSSIWFDAKSGNAVCKDKTSTPYDLNKGAGGDDIFMHFSTTAGNSVTPTSKGGISEVKLIGGSQSEVNNLKSTFKKSGWTVIESNLNAGTSGDCIYLCYKTAGDGCITDLYLSSGSNPVSNTLTVNGKTYTLCPYEGGGHFLSVRGDLNSNCGGDDIHLYYTKSGFSDNRCVSSIWFDAKSSNAVCKDKTSTPYDLNKGAGGNDIFMHFSVEK